MEVLKEEFEAKFELIKQAISEADFIAFDCEFTGLQMELHPLDSPQGRYVKLARSTSEYLINQFGFATFSWDPEKNQYICKPFNFYIFPNQVSAKYERKFLSLSSSLDFLAKNGFDFNKWVRHGLGYLNRDEEETILQKSNAQPPNSQPIELDEAGKKFIDEIFIQIDGWLQNSSTVPLNIPPCNSFHRRIIYEQVPKKYNNFLTLETDGKDSNKKGIRVLKLTQEQKAEHEAKKTQLIEKDLNDLIGFRRVIDLIAESNKIIIGHNMSLDILHTFQKFHRSTPPLLADFKKSLLKFFPRIFDTKYFLQFNPAFKDLFSMGTSVEEAYKRVQVDPFQSPSLVFAENFSDYENNPSKYHEAGYDAYTSGVIFIRAVHHFAKTLELETNVSVDILLQHEGFKKFINKIYVLRSRFNIFDLENEEPESDFKNIFYVHGFPKELTTNDLKLKFTEKNVGNIEIKWINDTSLFVIVKEEEKIESIIELFKDDTQMKVETYTSFKEKTKDKELQEYSPVSRKRPRIEKVEKVE